MTAQVGTFNDQAVNVLEADRVAATPPSNITGTGVTIGVLSDSFNNLGGASTDEADGNLPATVNVIQDLPSGGTDEGRAMLQLAHHTAPGCCRGVRHGRHRRRRRLRQQYPGPGQRRRQGDLRRRHLLRRADVPGRRHRPGHRQRGDQRRRFLLLRRRELRRPGLPQHQPVVRLRHGHGHRVGDVPELHAELRHEPQPRVLAELGPGRGTYARLGQPVLHGQRRQHELEHLHRQHGHQHGRRQLNHRRHLDADAVPVRGGPEHHGVYGQLRGGDPARQGAGPGRAQVRQLREERVRRRHVPVRNQSARR